MPWIRGPLHSKSRWTVLPCHAQAVCYITVMLHLLQVGAGNISHSSIHQPDNLSQTGMDTCQRCGKSFARGGYLLSHQLQCLGQQQGTFKCRFCQASYTSSTTLSDHVATMHQLQKYPCVCGRVFGWRTSLLRHKRHCEGAAQKQWCWSFAGCKSRGLLTVYDHNNHTDKMPNTKCSLSSDFITRLFHISTVADTWRPGSTITATRQ